MTTLFDNTQTPFESKTTFEELTEGVSLDQIAPEDYSYYVRQSQLVAREVGLLAGQKGLVINGRVSREIYISRESPLSSSY